jgi:integrase
MAGGEGMMVAVESYLAVRRAAGFTLSNTEYLLRSFAGFAADQKQTHIRTTTAIDWASQAKSVAQRHTRHQTICRFAQYLRVEDSRHELPPANHFGYRKSRRVPHIYSRDEIDGLVLAATRLPSSDLLLPKTYVALISLLAATGLRISEALHLLVSDITPNGFTNPQNEVSENPIGAVARHCRSGAGPLLDAPSRSATRWRSCLRFG